MSVTASGSTGRRPMSSRWNATSSVPSGGASPSILPSASASASANGDPAGLQADDHDVVEARGCAR